MRKTALLFSIIIIAAVKTSSVSLKSQVQTKTIPEIQYLSPVPNSKYVSKETNIIIKFRDDLNPASVNITDFVIEGSMSGVHSYRIVSTKEKNSIILEPYVNFTPGEVVKVNTGKGLKSVKGSKYSAYEFSFTVSSYQPVKKEQYYLPYSEEYHKYINGAGENPENFTPIKQKDFMPPDFPEISILVKNNPNPGYIFLSNFFKFTPGSNTPYLIVLENNGRPYAYRNMGVPCLDFKVQNNNTFTFFKGAPVEKFFSTDPSFNVKDSFYCGNGYSTDTHELLLLPDNHAYMMSYDTQMVDMSQIVQGGHPNALVVGLIIQEIDENKNVVFQWRSWDHIQITDATHENLLAQYIDYVHGNAIDLDYDGNVLISSRHLDEITKINRQTGQIMWRLGGKNNQFNFVNDTLKFSHQHCIRLLANGHYLLFDNGNFHVPPFSRVCEYDLNTTNMTATLVWQYRNSPDIFAFAMGSSQRLDDGNTVIGWGSANPTVTEVKPDGTKTFEMTFAPTVVSYRAFRHTWDGAPPQIPSTVVLEQNYPNPFNPLTSIDYGLSQNSFVTLKIYDILGREIRTLVNTNQEAGRYTVSFNAENLASGVYFYKLVANGSTEAKKMIFVK